MNTHSDLLRFRELLPFVVNGTLSEEDQPFMTAYIAAHPECQQEVDFAKALQNAVKATAATRPADAGLSRLLAAMQVQRVNNFVHWWQSLKASCSDWGLTPAFAAMALVATVQGFLLWSIYQGDIVVSEISALRSVPEMTSPAELKLMINPGARFEELVLLLRQVGAHIVNGPSATGELWVSLDDPSRRDAVIQQLRNAPGVADVLSLDARR